MVVQNKYRGTKEYFLVYKELITAAQYKGIITYQEIAKVMGLPPSGQHMGKEVGHLLGEIAEDENSLARPILSALAVGVSGIPGTGFFEFARQVGKLKYESGDKEKMFWEKEKAAVYRTWATKYEVNK